MKEKKLTINERETIFIERFRPKTIDEIILPEDFKNDVRKWKEEGQIPNLLLVSKKPGLGKTSLAHTIIHELNAEAKFINASLESNIDTLRSKIKGFVSTESFNGRPKIVVLDEADGLSRDKFQPALRAFIEEFSCSARFILTANYIDKIIEPLQDRLMDYNFDDIFNNNKHLVKDIYLRCADILKEQKITFEKADLVYLVKHFYPSTRSIVKKLEQFSYSGTLVINKDRLDSDTIIDNIVQTIKTSNFDEMRRVIINISDPSMLFSELYERLDDFPIEKRPPVLMIIAKYQTQDSLVRDRVVNVASMCAELMGVLRTNVE